MSKFFLKNSVFAMGIRYNKNMNKRKIIYLNCLNGIDEYAFLAAFLSLSENLGFDFNKQLESIGLFDFLILEDKFQEGLPKAKILIPNEKDFLIKKREDIPFDMLEDKIPKESLNKILEIIEELNKIEEKIYGNLVKERLAEPFYFSSFICFVGIVLLFSYLGVFKITFSFLPISEDSPLSPLCLELLKNMPFRFMAKFREISLWGAIILKNWGTNLPLNLSMNLEGAGYGCVFPQNKAFLSILLGNNSKEEISSFASLEAVNVLETNIDDMNPQYYGHLMEKLLSLGVLDVYWTSLQMKKNRPGQLITVICRDEQVKKVSFLLFQETSTLGLRIRQELRMILPRYIIKLDTLYGQVSIKVAGEKDKKALHWMPEYEDCKLLADNLGVPLPKIYEEVFRKALADFRLQ